MLRVQTPSITQTKIANQVYPVGSSLSYRGGFLVEWNKIKVASLINGEFVIMDLIFSVTGLIAIIGSVILMLRVRKKIPAGQISQEPLSKNEKVLIWVLNILNPVWTGFILYFGWKKKSPVKSKSSNTISFIVFIPWLLFYLFTGGIKY